MTNIVAFDDTDESRRAVKQAVRDAEEVDTNVIIVHAIEQNVGRTEYNSAVIESPKKAEENGRKVIESAQEIDYVQTSDVEVETELVYGNPAESVVDFTESLDAVSKVYVGHRDLSSEQEKMMGSVAKQIIDRETSPVVVV